MITDLIAWWKMNDNAASATVVDETGNHNGTYKDSGGDLNTETGSVAGKINNSLDFDGTDEYVEIADHADFTPALTPFSISVWVYMHAAQDFDFLSKGAAGVDLEWYFVVGNDSKILSALYKAEQTAYIARKYDTALTSYQNQWIHLALTYDGGILATGIKIYLNAVQVDDTSLVGGTFDSVGNLSHPVWVGRYDNGYANGLIDNLMFFSKELNQKEVRRLYKAGMGEEQSWSLQNRGLRGRYSNWSRSRYR